MRAPPRPGGARSRWDGGRRRGPRGTRRCAPARPGPQVQAGDARALAEAGDRLVRGREGIGAEVHEQAARTRRGEPAAPLAQAAVHVAQVVLGACPAVLVRWAVEVQVPLRRLAADAPALDPVAHEIDQPGRQDGGRPDPGRRADGAGRGSSRSSARGAASKSFDRSASLRTIACTTTSGSRGRIFSNILRREGKSAPPARAVEDLPAATAGCIQEGFEPPRRGVVLLDPLPLGEGVPEQHHPDDPRGLGLQLALAEEDGVCTGTRRQTEARAATSSTPATPRAA
jgi:hypothetical protein